MSEVVIRGAEPSDAQAIHEIYVCPGVFGNVLQLPWRSFEARRERLTIFRPNQYRLVGVVDDRVVGELGLHMEDNPRRRDCAWFGMAVHDEYQGRGVGSALMAAMIELADGWLCIRRLELMVWTANAPAVHLYEKFGFTIEGTAHHYARRAGEYVDAYYMARVR